MSHPLPRRRGLRVLLTPFVRSNRSPEFVGAPTQSSTALAFRVTTELRGAVLSVLSAGRLPGRATTATRGWWMLGEPEKPTHRCLAAWSAVSVARATLPRLLTEARDCARGLADVSGWFSDQRVSLALASRKPASCVARHIGVGQWHCASSVAPLRSSHVTPSRCGVRRHLTEIATVKSS